MRRGRQMARMMHHAINRTYTAGSKKTWIRGLSEQNAFSVSAVPSELLQLPTSLVDRTVNKQRQKLRRASLNSCNSLALCTPF
jgi:hypothetical protein